MVIFRRSGNTWPLLLAANRDEMSGRPWLPPARHWPDRDLVAGLDELAGGTWLGMNDHGLVAAILNRTGTLGPAPGKRSRGELPLEALDHNDAVDAAEAFLHLAPQAYRPFNMVIADNRDAYWLRSDGDRITVAEIPEGFSILTAGELNDTACPRIRKFLPLFQQAQIPDPEGGDWTAWQHLLSQKGSETSHGADALCIQREDGYGTSSSSLIALPAMDRPDLHPVWLFAPGRPGEAAFEPVPL
ncbi:NRDE family protein [Telmatospirillum sp. J64-1]|uniref:NRDE family protein n=1 Tax=Telmatospirillum sp. J64-1 TaxID=2502183 RepID=UPI00351AF4E5